MSDILCITNRRLCREDFLDRVRKIAAAHPKGIILREKDLERTEYRLLASRVIEICREYGTECILHSFTDEAIGLGAGAIHLPMPVLREMGAEQKAAFTTIGASCHSLAELKEAQALGCTYVTAGHIFDTDCKAGLPGRGLRFLEEMCSAACIPVYGIGGVSQSNIELIRAAGASGGCVMSGIMKCDEPAGFLDGFL